MSDEYTADKVNDDHMVIPRFVFFIVGVIAIVITLSKVIVFGSDRDLSLAFALFGIIFTALPATFGMGKSSSNVCALISMILVAASIIVT